MRSLLLACVLLVVTGCGASDPVASEDVSAAVDKTASVGSSRIAIVEESDDVDENAEGVVDYDGRRGRMTVAHRPDEDAPLQTGEAIFIGPVLYMESAVFGIDPEKVIPELNRKPKPWQSFSLDDAEPSLEALLFPFPYIDPSRLLDALEEVSGDVESLGGKEIRGAETDGYRLDVDLRRVVEEAPEAHREALLEQLERETQKTMAIEVWIDDEGFARRLTMLDPEEKVSVDFYDFGVDVDVEAPPEDQVDDFSMFWEGEESASVGDDEEAGSGELEELEDLENAPRVSTVTVEEDE